MSVTKFVLLPILVAASLTSLPGHAGSIDEVIKAGTLRACTPGDYKPFSFAKPDGSFEGIDIDLMQSLSASVGRPAKGLVGLKDLVKLEVVRDQLAGIDALGLHCLEQHRDRHRVH